MNMPARHSGFTLIELMVALAIVAILAVLALPAYRIYVVRAELAQLLVHVDQIATAVQVEDALGERRLEEGAVPGKAPPRLQVVPDASFNEPGGLRLFLIRAPKGTFQSYPDTAKYGLIADAPGAPDLMRLQQFRHVLPFVAGDKVWLTETTFAFPLVARAAEAGAAPPPPPPPSPPPPGPGTGWEGGGTVNGSTWTCQASVSVYGTDGKPLTEVNAGVRIKVVLSVTAYDGSPVERSWDDLGNLNGGKASFSISGLSAQASNGELVTGCRLQVVGVDYYWPTDPAVKWDGRLSQIDIPKP